MVFALGYMLEKKKIRLDDFWCDDIGFFTASYSDPFIMKCMAIRISKDGRN